MRPRYPTARYAARSSTESSPTAPAPPMANGSSNAPSPPRQPAANNTARCSSSCTNYRPPTPAATRFPDSPEPRTERLQNQAELQGSPQLLAGSSLGLLGALSGFLGRRLQYQRSMGLARRQGGCHDRCGGYARACAQAGVRYVRAGRRSLSILVASLRCSDRRVAGGIGTAWVGAPIAANLVSKPSAARAREVVAILDQLPPICSAH